MAGRRRGFRARNRARPSSAHQSILLIKEMLFDYLIASVAQQLADLAQNQVTVIPPATSSVFIGR